MVDRSVHLAVRGLVAGLPAPAVPAPGSPAAAPGGRARLGPFELAFEAARPRILPGEENELSLRWKAVEAGASATPPLQVQLVLDLPAEVSAPEAARSARATLGGGQDSGEVRFFLTGEEPGGVWIDGLLTLEDDGGAVLARAKAGFAVARHRVVISDVEVVPPVAAAGDAVTVRARYAWTGASRVRGALGGTLRRRADGAVLELHAEKVSALGERSHEWALKAPVDLEVADFDVELTFEGKEALQRAQFGKTGVLAVRRAADAEVASVHAATARWGADAPVDVRVLVRNTGVRPLEGSARLEVLLRAPGAPEAEGLAAAAAPASVALAIPPSQAAEAAFEVRLPRGHEGRRVEARAVASFGSLSAEKREVLGHLVADHVLEFDGFAADRFAYGPGEEAAVEFRVRDDGARPGGAFEVGLRLLEGAREVAAGEASVALEGRAASVRARLTLPKALDTRGALDLELAVPAHGALRRVPGFLRVRRPVASRVVIVKPAAAVGTAAYLFEGEAVASEEPLGDIEGAGACRLVLLESGAYFVGGPDFAPVVGPPAALERAVCKALLPRVGPPPPAAHAGAWERVLRSLEGSSTGTQGRGAGLPDGPAGAAARIAGGAPPEAESSGAAADLATALRLTAAALEGSRLPSAEIANRWVAAAESAAKGGRGGGPVAAALRTARVEEARSAAALAEGGLDGQGLSRLALLAAARRAAEAQLLAEAVAAGAPDRVLGLSVALRGREESLRTALRYFQRLLQRVREGAAFAAREGAARRRLAALRLAKVAVKGADAIVPGGYNTVEVEVLLPRESPAGGSVSAAVALPSDLWIVASEAALMLRGNYLLPPSPLAPGGRVAWPLSLYVPDRAGGEPGAIEVRVGFEDDEPTGAAPKGADPA